MTNGLPDFSGTVQREMDIKKGLATIEQAKREYPLLNKQNMQYSVNPMQDKGFLEYYSGDETGSEDHPRPQEFEMGTPGIEIRDINTRPIDVIGDWASHEGIKTDPIIADHYRQFRESITPEQQKQIKWDYEFDRKNRGEERDFDTWLEMTGMPGVFRQYPFQQGDDFKYTPEQELKLDEMMQYLRQGAE